jgi:hypothetical protein
MTMVHRLLFHICKEAREMMESMSNGDVAAVRRRGGPGGLLPDGGAEGTDQVCTDPKSCPQPGALTPEARFDADQLVCTDPKSCPQP